MGYRERNNSQNGGWNTGNNLQSGWNARNSSLTAGILHKIAGTLITRSRVGIREIVSSQVGIQIIPSKTGTI